MGIQVSQLTNNNGSYIVPNNKSGSVSPLNKHSQEAPPQIAKEIQRLVHEVSRIISKENISYNNPAYTREERINKLKSAVLMAERVLKLQEQYSHCPACLSSAHGLLAQAYFVYWKNQGPVEKMVSLNHFAILAEEHFQKAISIFSTQVRKQTEILKQKHLIPSSSDYLQLASYYGDLAKLQYALGEANNGDESMENLQTIYGCVDEIGGTNTNAPSNDSNFNAFSNRFNTQYRKSSNMFNLYANIESSKRASQTILRTLKLTGLEILRRLLFEKIKIVEKLSNMKKPGSSNFLTSSLSKMFQKTKDLKLFYILEAWEAINLLFEGFGSSESTIGLSKAYENFGKKIFESISNFSWKLTKNLPMFSDLKTD